MRIVITGRDFSTYDTHAVRRLEAAGHQVTDYSKAGYSSGTSEEEIIRAAKDADVVIIGLEPYSRYVLDHCRNLKMISRRGIGYDNVDLEACRERGITVARTVGAVEGAVAEHVLAYILYYARRVDMQNEEMQNRRWTRFMMDGAKNHTLGLVGFGGIGKEIAKRAVPFGMKVVYYCRHPRKEWETEYGVTYMPMDELLAASDYVSVNVPLTENTRGMFDKELFGKMKKGSYFINIARGAVAVEEDLRDALVSGHLAGAAVDTFSKEPCTDSCLAGVEGTVLTPHTATYTKENFVEMNEIAAKNILDFLKGRLERKYQVM